MKVFLKSESQLTGVKLALPLHSVRLSSVPVQESVPDKQDVELDN